MNKIYTAYLKVFICVVVWGASFVATKMALQNGIVIASQSPSLAFREISPITVVWLRFTLGVVILGLAVVARGQFSLPQRKDLGYFALLGLLGITFHQWLQSNGLVTAQATTSAWIVATTPVFMALLGWLWLKEKLAWLKWGGIALAGAGVLMVVSKGDWAALSVGRFGTVGDFLILISAPNWAVFSVASRSGLRSHPAARMMLFVMGFGWLFTTILLLLGPGFAEIARLTLRGWLGVLFLGVFCSGLAYIFWYDGLQALAASQVGAFLYLEPLITVAVAAAVLGEPLLPASLAGGSIILVGVWLVNRQEG